MNGANIILKKGGTMGDLYMTSDFKRDAEGNVAIKDGNVSQVNLTNPSYRGSVLPRVTSVSLTTSLGRALTSDSLLPHVSVVS